MSLTHITNERTKGMPHEAGEYTCWCIESVPVLQAEVERLQDEVRQAGHALGASRRSHLRDIWLHQELARLTTDEYGWYQRVVTTPTAETAGGHSDLS